MTTFEEDLRNLINAHSKEMASDTPDFILAQYLCFCLDAFNRGVNRRDAFNENVERGPGDTAQPVGHFHEDHLG